MRGKYERLSDERLAARAGRGDEPAFAALGGRYADELGDFALSVVRDRDLATEVVVRALGRVWDRLTAGVRVDLVRPWLYSTAREEALSTGGGYGAGYEELESAWRANGSASERGIPLHDELVRVVRASALAFNARDYSLLDLHLRRNLSAGDLAAALSLDRASVSVSLERLRAALEAPVIAYVLARCGRGACETLDATLLATAGAPPSDVRAAIRRHAGSCGACRTSLSRMPRPAEIFAGLAAVDPAPSFGDVVWPRVARHLARARAGASGSFLPSKALVAGAGVTAVAVGAAVTAFVVLGDRDPAGDRAAGPAAVASRTPGSVFLPPVRQLPSVAPSRAPAPGDGATPAGPASPSEGHTFAWAGVEGAAEYVVRVYRDDVVVFSARTREASLVIPAAWRYDGHAQTLTPGVYRWYVWPIMKGSETPSRKASVSSQLVVG